MINDTENIEGLLVDFQAKHSNLQMGAFIVDKSAHGHPYGRYMQALRELHSRYAHVQNLQWDIRESSLDLADLLDVGLDTDLRTPLAIERLEHKLSAMRDTLAEVKRELEFFHAAASECKLLVGELTPERRDNLDREFWVHRLRFKAAVDIFREGRPSIGVVESVASLPTEMREAVIQFLQPAAAKGLVDWFHAGAPMQLALTEEPV